jgi:hypothetical protein
LSRAHLPEDTAVSPREHLAEGDGIRTTERRVRVHRDPVMRHGRLAGPRARDRHDELVALSPSDVRGPIR